MTKKLKNLQKELVVLYSDVKEMSIGKIVNQFRVPYQEAEDLYQHSFMKAYRKLDAFKGGSSLKTWFYRIINNATIDALRKPYIKNQRCSFSMDVEECGYIKELQDHHNNPSQILLTEEHTNNLKIRIQFILDKLSPTHKRVIGLVYRDGGSYEKAAKVMKCSIGTIMSRAFYARKHFIKLYSNIEARDNRNNIYN